jgi:hypothetical protein
VHQIKEKGTNALVFVPFSFIQYLKVRTPQFDKTHRVLDSRQAAPQGEAFGSAKCRINLSG